MPHPTKALHEAAFLNSAEILRARLSDTTLILHTLRHLAQERSSGPYADCTDFLRDIYLLRHKTPTNKTEKYPQTQTLSALLNQLYSSALPKEIREYVSNNESVSFHKEPDKLHSIRPIGIGTAIRRIAAAHAMAATKDKAAAYLAPTKFAIGLSGGMNMVTQTLQTQTNHHIATPTAHNLPHTRAILTLDLTNMFNSVSMVRAREKIY